MACPLLIETPSSQGTELLTTIDEFQEFYQRFNQEDQQRIRICIDTCHVFASGYDPLEYLSKWINTMGRETVGLIHFNDSKDVKGSKKDRHAPIGNGKIGKNILYQVMKYAVDQKIDMVVE